MLVGVELEPSWHGPIGQELPSGYYVLGKLEGAKHKITCGTLTHCSPVGNVITVALGPVLRLQELVMLLRIFSPFACIADPSTV